MQLIDLLVQKSVPWYLMLVMSSSQFLLMTQPANKMLLIKKKSTQNK